MQEKCLLLWIWLSYSNFTLGPYCAWFDLWFMIHISLMSSNLYMSSSHTSRILFLTIWITKLAVFKSREPFSSSFCIIKYVTEKLLIEFNNNHIPSLEFEFFMQEKGVERNVLLKLEIIENVASLWIFGLYRGFWNVFLGWKALRCVKSVWSVYVYMCVFIYVPYLVCLSICLYLKQILIQK